MTEGTAFTLHPEHLGLHRRTFRVWLHARVTRELERIRLDLPDSAHDVLDAQGTRLRAPDQTGDFTQPVDEFDAPAGAPGSIVVYGPHAAALFSDAFPDMPRRPWAASTGAAAFELDKHQLGRDAFGFTRLNPDVSKGIETALAESHAARCTVLDGEGLPVPPLRSGGSDRIESLDGEPISVMNGFQPQYLAFADARAAEAFARQFPRMRRHALDDLERIWRAARTG